MAGWLQGQRRATDSPPPREVETSGSIADRGRRGQRPRMGEAQGTHPSSPREEECAGERSPAPPEDAVVTPLGARAGGRGWLPPPSMAEGTGRERTHRSAHYLLPPCGNTEHLHPPGCDYHKERRRPRGSRHFGTSAVGLQLHSCGYDKCPYPRTQQVGWGCTPQLVLYEEK